MAELNLLIILANLGALRQSIAHNQIHSRSRESPYQNTTLEEPLPAQLPPATTFAFHDSSDEDKEGEPTDDGDDEQNEYEVCRARQDLARVLRDNGDADEKSDKLRAHYQKEESLVDNLTQTLVQLQQEDNTTHDAFKTQITNAYLATEADARRFGIISRFVQVPACVKSAVDLLGGYY